MPGASPQASATSKSTRDIMRQAGRPQVHRPLHARPLACQSEQPGAMANAPWVGGASCPGARSRPSSGRPLEAKSHLAACPLSGGPAFLVTCTLLARYPWQNALCHGYPVSRPVSFRAGPIEPEVVARCASGDEVDVQERGHPWHGTADRVTAATGEQQADRRQARRPLPHP